MIKRTTFVYTKDEIQELIDKEEVVKILYANCILVTMIVNKWIGECYYNDSPNQLVDDPALPFFGSMIIGFIGWKGGKKYIYRVPVDSINRIEVLDEPHALVWKLENHF